MRKAFTRLLGVRDLGMEDEDALATELDDVLQEDGLKEQLRVRQRQGNNYISTAAKLLAPVIEQDIVAGFNWVGDVLRAQSQQALATEIEMAKSLYFMRSKEFDKAIETLKSYEKKDHMLVAHAATNLSFITALSVSFWPTNCQACARAGITTAAVRATRVQTA